MECKFWLVMALNIFFILLSIKSFNWLFMKDYEAQQYNRGSSLNPYSKSCNNCFQFLQECFME